MAGEGGLGAGSQASLSVSHRERGRRCFSLDVVTRGLVCPHDLIFGFKDSLTSALDGRGGTGAQKTKQMLETLRQYGIRRGCASNSSREDGRWVQSTPPLTAV